MACPIGHERKTFSLFLQVLILANCRCVVYPLFSFAELTHRALPEHLETCAQSHMLLLLRRVTEQQGVIVANRQKLNALENTVTAHTANLAALDTAVAAAVAGVDHVERRVLKTLRDEMATATKKHSKDISSLQSELNSLKNSVSRVAADQHALARDNAKASNK